MIKTLRITSVAAVVFAGVVLASVLGFLRPDVLPHLNFGVRPDKQVEKILGGPSAVDRFKEKNGDKKGNAAEIPPLIKQAQLFADIINPRALPPGQTTIAQKGPRPTFTAKQPVLTSSKFDLLGTCYCSDPKKSLAYIRLPDSTPKWVGVGSEIGHVTIKEIGRGSIVCSDGSKEYPMNAEPAPETSTLLETGKAPKDLTSAKSPTASLPAAAGRGTSVKPQTATSSRIPVATARAVPGSSRAAGLGTPLPSTQISKEEQENLSQLGNKLKASAGADSNSAATGKLISDYKSSLGTPPPPGSVPNPTSDPADAYKGAWKDRMKEESLRQWQKRLAPPRPTPPKK